MVGGTEMDTSGRQRIGLLILRVALGLIFVLHGWMNIVGGQESFLREMLAMVGWSAPDGVVWLITAFELLGGIALMLGLFARGAASLLAVEMVVAVVLFHVRQGFFIVAVPNAPLAYGFEYHLALVGGLVCVALAGPGGFALGDRITRRRQLQSQVIGQKV
jgi:putative oxidoreductase